MTVTGYLYNKSDRNYVNTSINLQNNKIIRKRIEK